jgi:hypothetical protein
MIQFYLLSVLLNILCGYALAAKKSESASQIIKGAEILIADPGLRLTIAILSIAVGVLKLLFALRGDIPVIGDFLPATAGIVVGATLLLDISEATHLPFAKKWKLAARLEKQLLSYKQALGYVGIMAGIIHFLFPMVLFL